MERCKAKSGRTTRLDNGIGATRESSWSPNRGDSSLATPAPGFGLVAFATENAQHEECSHATLEAITAMGYSWLKD